MEVVNITDLPDGSAIIEVEMDKEERDTILSWAIRKLLISAAQELAGIEPE
jgi:hypothetical protein